MRVATKNGGGRADAVSLLRADPSLRAAIPEDELDSAVALTTVPRLQLSSGRWHPELTAGFGQGIGALLLEGVLLHEVKLGGRTSAHLLAPGDLLDPWTPMETALPCSVRWTCVGDVVMAVLTDGFEAAVARWPALADLMQRPLAQQVRELELRAVINALPRAEQRVLALFWQLAGRWGTVKGDEVIVRLELTHELVGRLVGSERPTVTLALGALADEQLLTRDASGRWRLARHSAERLASRWQ